LAPPQGPITIAPLGMFDATRPPIPIPAIVSRFLANMSGLGHTA
jgi:hypothetical protein